MARTILGVILGYVIMAVLVFGGLTAAYLAMGSDRAFRPASFDVSIPWLVTNITISALAAFLGGMAAGVIARRSKAALILGGIILILGGAVAIGQVLYPKPDPGPRDGAIANLDAMMKARQPTWYMFAIPMIGSCATAAAERVLRRRGN